MQEPHFLYYSASIPASYSTRSIPVDYQYEIWRPALFCSKPRDLPAFPFTVWWLFHLLHIFTNREYGIVLIRRHGRIVHRSVITPRYFRFPFMRAGDIQVGDTWTDPEMRGLGLATSALEQILVACTDRRHTCWYVVESSNTPSIRVVEKAGFSLVGKGVRTRRLGLGILGQFRIDNRCDVISSAMSVNQIGSKRNGETDRSASP